MLADGRRARGRDAVASALLLIAVLVFIASFTALSLFGPTLLPAPPLRLAGLLLALAALYLCYLSLVKEPGKGGSAAGKPVLVREGTYGLSRHPGVLWLLIFHGALVLATGSLPLLAALPLWTCLNIAAALVEDRVYFPRRFGADYHAYKEEVPFLLPNRKSLRRTLERLGRRPAGRDR